jgi:hypothetical protein
MELNAIPGLPNRRPANGGIGEAKAVKFPVCEIEAKILPIGTLHTKLPAGNLRHVGVDGAFPRTLGPGDTLADKTTNWSSAL